MCEKKKSTAHGAGFLALALAAAAIRYGLSHGDWYSTLVWGAMTYVVLVVLEAIRLNTKP